MLVAPYDPVWMIISHPNGLKWLLYKYRLIKVTCFHICGSVFPSGRNIYCGFVFLLVHIIRRKLVLQLLCKKVRLVFLCFDSAVSFRNQQGKQDARISRNVHEGVQHLLLYGLDF